MFHIKGDSALGGHSTGATPTVLLTTTLTVHGSVEMAPTTVSPGKFIYVVESGDDRMFLTTLPDDPALAVRFFGVAASLGASAGGSGQLVTVVLKGTVEFDPALNPEVHITAPGRTVPVIMYDDNGKRYCSFAPPGGATPAEALMSSIAIALGSPDSVGRHPARLAGAWLVRLITMVEKEAGSGLTDPIAIRSALTGIFAAAAPTGKNPAVMLTNTPPMEIGRLQAEMRAGVHALHELAGQIAYVSMDGRENMQITCT